jgi:hypothetical protein
MRRLTVALASLLPVISLAGEAPNQGLLVPPDAEEVTRKTGSEAATVTYEVREAFPATRTLTFVQSSLAREGWTAVAGAALRSYERSSLEAGWREIPVGNTGGLVQIWSGRWTDAAGNEVTYSLVYSSSLTQHGLRPAYVGVSAWYYSASEAARNHARMLARIAKDRLVLPPRPAPTPCPE